MYANRWVPRLKGTYFEERKTCDIDLLDLPVRSRRSLYCFITRFSFEARKQEGEPGDEASTGFKDLELGISS